MASVTRSIAQARKAQTEYIGICHVSAPFLSLDLGRNIMCLASNQRKFFVEEKLPLQQLHY